MAWFEDPPWPRPEALTDERAEFEEDRTCRLNRQLARSLELAFGHKRRIVGDEYGEPVDVRRLAACLLADRRR